MNRVERGRGGEDLAWGHLRRAGYRLVARNLRSRYGEIDLVVERGDTLVFVEVRARSGTRFGTAIESIDGRKRRQVARLAANFLARRRLDDRRARFDVVAVEWQDGAPKIEHVENAFEVPEYMLDIRAIRDRPDFFRSELAKVGYGAEDLGALLAADERRRRLIQDVERRRAERAKGSREINKIEDPTTRATAVAEMKRAGEDLGRLEKELADAESTFERLLLEVPNLPHPAVPIGRDERDNRVVRTEGDEPRREFTPRPHWEIGPELGVLDFERGVKISGSRFYVLLDAGARLQRALIAWMIDLHVREHGYVEVYPPAMVKRECLVGTGNLPKFGENLYRDAEEDLWFVPTAEVPVTNLYRDEILDAARLPLRHVAYTPCFRREKMSAGRDVRGIKRGHQFDKVEMVKFVHPDDSDAELDSLLEAAVEVCRRLGLRHRIVEMCTGDLSFTAARKFDIEVWAAGCEEWLEVSSCSNFRDFQARRANIRFRPSGGGKPELVHTLNGSGLALPRVLIAVLENFQNADGSITVPEVLRPYAGGMSVIGR